MSNTSNNPIVRSEQLRALVAGVIEELKSEQVGVKTVLLAPYGAQWLAEGGETLKEGDVVVIKNSSITRVGFIGEVPADPYFGVGIVTREIGVTSPTCDIVAFDNTHQLIYLELSFDGGWIRQSFSLNNFLTTATANETYLKKTDAASTYATKESVPKYYTDAYLSIESGELKMLNGEPSMIIRVIYQNLDSLRPGDTITCEAGAYGFSYYVTISLLSDNKAIVSSKSVDNIYYLSIDEIYDAENSEIGVPYFIGKMHLIETNANNRFEGIVGTVDYVTDEDGELIYDETGAPIGFSSPFKLTGIGADSEFYISENMTFRKRIHFDEYDYLIGVHDDNRIIVTSLKYVNPDMSNITSLEAAFYMYENLTSLDLSSLDTSNVTNMKYAFECLYKLKTLDLSYFDTSNVTSMNAMFAGDSALTTLNISSFDMSKVEDVLIMFWGCINLRNLRFGKNCKVDLDLHESPLTHTSALSVINGLAQVPTTRTLILHPTTYSSISSEEVALASSKGWTISVDLPGGGGSNTGGSN